MTYCIYSVILKNMGTYYRYFIKKNIDVSNIVTIEYIDVKKDFCYEEERHAFFEFAYVDSGKIICRANDAEHILSQGDLFFLPPATLHSYRSAGEANTKLFIVCANCKAGILDLISGKHALDEKEKAEISAIFFESKKAFRFPFAKKLVPLESAYFGAQQLTEAHIEILLTKLIRKKLSDSPEVKFVMNSEGFNYKLVNDLLSMLKERVYGQIDLNEITQAVHYSKTYINNIFKKNIGMPIMKYFYGLKIAEAKKMLDKGVSVSEISDKLNYDNPNYFTKAFKSFTGQTPSQYKQSINKQS